VPPDPGDSVHPQEQPRPELQIGGQAVIEGVVMRGPDRWALAVRRPSGDTFITVNPVMTLAQRYPRWNRFPARGILALADSLIIGVKALTISGGISLEEAEEKKEEEGGASEAGLEADEREGAEVEAEKSAISTPAIVAALVFALAIFLGLFIVLPTLLASPLSKHVHNTVVYNLIEGGIRITIFILYLVAMSLMPDVRRVFEYHGAEHKVVHAYEAGDPLTPEAASKYSTAHLRCGTAFILIVFVLSILIFSFLGRPALWLRVLERLAIIPFVAAFSYEIIRFAGKHEDSRWVRAVLSPGMLLQKLTTREPDDEQLAVAIDALEAAIATQPVAVQRLEERMEPT